MVFGPDDHPFRIIIRLQDFETEREWNFRFYPPKDAEISKEAFIAAAEMAYRHYRNMRKEMDKDAE